MRYTHQKCHNPKTMASWPHFEDHTTDPILTRVTVTLFTTYQDSSEADPKPLQLTICRAILRSFTGAVAAGSRVVPLPQHNVLALEALQHVTVLLLRRLELHSCEQGALRRRLAEMRRGGSQAEFACDSEFSGCRNVLLSETRCI